MKTLLFTIAVFFSFMAPSLKAEMKLNTFVTDGCTLFVDGTPAKPELWKHCCVEHDIRYWFGGSDEDMDKTDLRLKACVEKAAGATWGNLIYNGVRAGHHSPIKNKYQWSWGWREKREKIPLSQDESAFVLNELKQVRPVGVNMEEFVKFYFPNQTAP